MAKRTQIVCQHLENISKAVLEEYQDLIRDYIRGRHGIYALYRRDKLYYVGLASNLRVRLKQHLHDKHSNNWDRFSVYLTIDDKAIKELETLLLRILKKSDGNRAGGRFVRSQNLALQLGRDIREHSRAHLCHLLGRERRVKPAKPQPEEQNGDPPPLAQYFQHRVKLRAQHKQNLPPTCDATAQCVTMESFINHRLPLLRPYAVEPRTGGTSGTMSERPVIG